MVLAIPAVIFALGECRPDQPVKCVGSQECFTVIHVSSWLV